MKKLSPVLFLGLALVSGLQAEPFQKAEVSKTVNTVSLVDKQKARKAAVGDAVAGQTAVKTGGDSRAELRFPDSTITRLGANTFFTFQSGSRSMDLDGGTVLFSAPKGEGGGQIQAGAVTAAVTGTSFLLSRFKSGEVKLVVLEGKVVLFFTGDPKQRRQFRAGQLVSVPAGATEIPGPIAIDLRRLISTSRLLEGGDFGPLPENLLITRVADSQQGRLRHLPDVLVRDQQAAQTARNVSNQPGAPAPAVKTRPAPAPAPVAPPPPPPPIPRPTGTPGYFGG